MAADGTFHAFSLLVDGTGAAALSCLALSPQCPDHKKASKVTRNRTHGRGLSKRQRYRCAPDSGKVHFFTPPLPREHVNVGQESCATCLDLLNPHQGELAAARRSHWTLRDIVTALTDPSRGASYASVGIELRKRGKQIREHLITAHGGGLALTGTALADTSHSRVAKEGRKAWHLAADLVEQYAPLLFAQTMTEVQERERQL